MAGIVGTITNLSDFLSKTQVCLSVKPNDPQQQIICLEADRKYSIPAFQREVRWDDNNLKMLLYDLSRSSKFLGNIILTIKSDHTCEIIDGQQRTTVLMLIVSCIKKKFGTKISTPDLCPLRNEGFTGFQTLLEKAFDQEAITSDDWNAILKSDDYHQLPRIQKLWNTISSSELLADRHKAQGLLDNLCKSEFNIIASYSNDVNTSIQYFLDVNLKGIRLDTEDIFKGYLFSQDSRELTRSLWQKNKRDVLRLNGVTQSSEEKRYPLMKLYEHFFYCDLYLPREGDCEYSTLKFGENFCLTSGFESGSTKYYEGSHLIEAIRDRDYLQNVLSRLNKCVEIMTDIIESEGPSTPFKDKFICAKKVDSIDIQNCHSMLKKILMEKEVIPKILALKYILTYFDGKPHAKEEYKSVYSVFCAAVLFTVFANKKESDTFYNFIRLEEWKSKINKWLYDYISSHALTRGKVLAAYKYSESDDDPIQQIRCKSLAAISNFFKVTKNGDNYNMGISNAAELCKFFGDKTVYSLEHFIVGECGTLHVKTAKYDFSYKYPPTIQKYRNSLFNFIFIPQPLNSSLSNEGLFIKVAEIHTHENEIKCSYSKGYYGLLNKSPRMYVFSALAASVDGDMKFVPADSNENAGLLEIDMTASFLINDGQHRKAAIEAAIAEDESLKEETISIVLYKDQGLQRSQQMFTDLNKHAVTTSKSLNTLYESKDPVALITKNVVNSISFLRKYTDKEKDNLSKYSSNIFTLNTFYTANKRICKVIHDQDNAEKLVYTFWNHVVVNMREWNEMDSGELSKKSLREDYITTQGLIILALGRLGEFYCVNPQINMAKSLKGLKKIDWLRNNEACWMNRAIKPNGKINRNEQGIFLTYIQIKRLLSLPISDEEAKKERIMMG